ncbi:hypothetical protein [Photorhabdus bodei]|uniref:Uncharacterized protein n=1 Tax=Photorhabdus bodei TaxID=2029681 RepID=A0A329XAC8_9GAMM|nr:hypothetical protein [Photorhabdus bodei]NDK98389.1 hypothetical protein [Photorhabdus bodei]NDL02637.1 hypothetical protein [Photorhabdus bodei]NDL06876.1 hypothetical protein [Photorhabdus bodei]RAX13455.1 hypothetical protein CKY02_06570 [Photorhabdus bodei]
MEVSLQREFIIAAELVNHYANGMLLSTPFFHEALNRDAKKGRHLYSVAVIFPCPLLSRFNLKRKREGKENEN